MARTALLCVLPAVLIASGWSQLETPPQGGDILLVSALGVGVGLLRRRWLQILGAVAAFLVAAHLAFGLSPLDARPFDDRDFFGPLVSGIWNGALDYYEITIPFDPNDRPRMHGALLLAAFGFALAASVAIGRRRPVLASALTFAGAAWPVTLIRDTPSTARGALLLVAALVLLAALRPAGIRGTGQTALVGGAILVAALVAVSSPAVAKGGFLSWEQWEPYKRPDRPVDVSYVWDADYDGIRFPKRPTTVLTVRVPRAGRSVPYWRATTLDSFIDDHWIQDQTEIEPTEIGGLDVLLEDPLLPPDASDSDRWLEQEVTIEALRDNHLVGATNAIAFERGEAFMYTPGVGHVQRLRRGYDYRVWSYVRLPGPRRLARSPAVYPDEALERYLATGFGFSMPPFGEPGRDEFVQRFFRDEDTRVYKPLYDTALEVVGRPRNPYAAVVALEAWFRQGADFVYDENPPARSGVPPLVAFVNGHRRGYCQHFAGAMALMLRYLGIPARVGAGFTTGNYDAEDRVWTVSDTNAHTWVEVWFAGYGWLPFDPTPGRGRLRGPYTSSSFTFDASGATSAFALGATALGLEALRSRLGDGGRNAANDRARGFDRGGARAGESAPADDGGGGGSLIALLLGVAAALTAGIWLLKLVRRHLRYLTRDPRRLAGAVRLDLIDYLVDQRLLVSASVTPAELSRRLEREVGIAGHRLAEALAAARYGPAGGAEDAARRARRELRTVRRRLRRRLGTGARLRGLVSLRSLGLGSA